MSKILKYVRQEKPSPTEFWITVRDDIVGYEKSLIQDKVDDEIDEIFFLYSLSQKHA